MHSVNWNFDFGLYDSAILATLVPVQPAFRPKTSKLKSKPLMQRRNSVQKPNKPNPGDNGIPKVHTQCPEYTSKYKRSKQHIKANWILVFLKIRAQTNATYPNKTHINPNQGYKSRSPIKMPNFHQLSAKAPWGWELKAEELKKKSNNDSLEGEEAGNEMGDDSWRIKGKEERNWEERLGNWVAGDALKCLQFF